jgi:hypothetical protein
MHDRIDNALWLAVGLVLFCATLGHAHHGGLGIEGDLVEWALNVDQWQEERLDQGYRIKFLAYPRQPIRGSRTRIVFEIQRVDTGQYVSGLTAQLHIQAPDGTQRTLPLPETTGVTAYYETTTAFAHTGEHTLTFRATDVSVSFSGTFRRGVSSNALFGDWPTVVGNLTVFAAFAVTWLGLILAVQRRFTPPSGQ